MDESTHRADSGGFDSASERRAALNEEFRDRRRSIMGRGRPVEETMRLFEEYARCFDTSGQKFSRDQMSER